VGKLQDALTLYSEALEIDPNNVLTNSKLYNNRATVLARVRDAFSLASCTVSCSVWFVLYISYEYVFVDICVAR